MHCELWIKKTAYDRKIYSQKSKITNQITQTINYQLLVVICICLSSCKPSNHTTGLWFYSKLRELLLQKLQKEKQNTTFASLFLHNSCISKTKSLTLPIKHNWRTIYVKKIISHKSHKFNKLICEYLCHLWANKKNIFIRLHI